MRGFGYLSQNSGLTLLETIVAFVLLVVVVVGVFGALTSAFRTNSISRATTIAYKACQEVMEQLMAMNYSTLPAQNNITFDVLGIDGLPAPNGIGRVNVDDVTPLGLGTGKLYQINIYANYLGNAQTLPINIHLTTQKAKP